MTTNIVTCDELIAKIRDLDSSLIIADVRSKQSHEEGHIDNAIHFTLKSLAEVVEEGSEMSQKEIILYCDEGTILSRIVADILANQNIQNVSVLEGGFSAWCQFAKKTD
jgi:rhodanese-related sulfurtransferase